MNAPPARAQSWPSATGGSGESPKPGADTASRWGRAKWWVLGGVVVLCIGGAFAAGYATGQASHAVPTAQSDSDAPAVPSEAPSQETGASTSTTPDASPVPPVPPVSPWIDSLDSLSSAAGNTPPAYDRALFGQPWADVDRNGCDTRNDILGRDLVDPEFKVGTGDCKVIYGTLTDPYDATTVEFVSGTTTSVLVQIDHVVALAAAWRGGAYAWTDEERETFANDPVNLIASSQKTNQAKSDHGPGEWLPSTGVLQCRYVQQWVEVYDLYDLSVDEEDRAAARDVLQQC